jgi:hypothetical protein
VRFGLQGFLLNRGGSQDRNSTDCVPIIWCAAHRPEQDQAIAEMRSLQSGVTGSRFVLPVVSQHAAPVVFDVSEFVRPLSEQAPETDALAGQKRLGGGSSVLTTAPIATAGTTDTRPGRPGISAHPFWQQVAECARLHHSRTIVRCRL